jgi:hypothetical protein
VGAPAAAVGVRVGVDVTKGSGVGWQEGHGVFVAAAVFVATGVTAVPATVRRAPRHTIGSAQNAFEVMSLDVSTKMSSVDPVKVRLSDDTTPVGEVAFTVRIASGTGPAAGERMASVPGGAVRQSIRAGGGVPFGAEAAVSSWLQSRAALYAPSLRSGFDARQVPGTHAEPVTSGAVKLAEG